jgi:hypothetical protein
MTLTQKLNHLILNCINNLGNKEAEVKTITYSKTVIIPIKYMLLRIFLGLKIETCPGSMKEDLI